MTPDKQVPAVSEMAKAPELPRSTSLLNDKPMADAKAGVRATVHGAFNKPDKPELLLGGDKGVLPGSSSDRLPVQKAAEEMPEGNKPEENNPRYSGMEL